MFEFEAVASCLGDQAAHLSLGGGKVAFSSVNGGLPDRHLHLVRLLVELH